MKLIELLSNSKPRSTVLRPFYWAMIIPTSLFGLCMYSKSDWWIILILLVLLIIAFIAFLAAYFICLSRNPDNLRSESYNINKLEIEKYAASSSKNKT